MDEIAKKLLTHVDEKEIKIELKHSCCFGSYQNRWEKQASGSAVNKALYLLKDYAKSNWFELAITGHWNRHHVGLIRAALVHFEKNPPQNTKAIIDYLVKKLALLKKEELNLNGTLMPRLKFIAAQEDNYIIKNPAFVQEEGLCRTIS